MLSQQIATNVTENDRVILYPTFGRLSADGDVWQIPVNGTVYEAGDACRRKRLWLELLQRLNKFHPSDEQREIFEQRVQAFVARTTRGKQLSIRAGRHIRTFEKATNRYGAFSGVVQLSARDVDELKRNGRLRDGWLQLEVVGPDGAPTGFMGAAQLLNDDGVSVISDIDDTVKVTHVTRRRSLLENTFLRPFEAVAGMADAYQQWASEGVAFHYVSSSPWQLFAPIRELFEQVQLPRGAFHLSAFTFRNHVLHRFGMLRKRAKLTVLKCLLESFPRRRFVLVGDSGERDPEIYGALARRFPAHVVGIYIRELSYRPMSSERSEHAFRKLSGSSVRIFREPHELPGTLVQ